MRNKKLLLILMTALMPVALVAALGGCAPGASEGESGKGAATSTSGDFPPGSLKAVHIAGQLDDVQEYNNKLCLGCHTREDINKATEDYGGTVGFNPHQSHNAAGDCTTCHSVDATSTLTCNECHNEDPPEGWQSVERGSGPLHDLSK